MTANGNPSHSLIVTQPFPVGRSGKNRFLEPPSILAVTQLGYVMTHLFPPQASLPVCELLWPVPVYPPETFPGLTERLSPEAWPPHTDLFAPLLHLAEESQKGT